MFMTLDILNSQHTVRYYVTYSHSFRSWSFVFVAGDVIYDREISLRASVIPWIPRDCISDDLSMWCFGSKMKGLTPPREKRSMGLVYISIHLPPKLSKCTQINHILNIWFKKVPVLDSLQKSFELHRLYIFFCQRTGRQLEQNIYN